MQETLAIWGRDWYLPLYKLAWYEIYSSDFKVSVCKDYLVLQFYCWRLPCLESFIQQCENGRWCFVANLVHIGRWSSMIILTMAVKHHPRRRWSSMIILTMAVKHHPRRHWPALLAALTMTSSLFCTLPEPLSYKPFFLFVFMSEPRLLRVSDPGI